MKMTLLTFILVLFLVGIVAIGLYSALQPRPMPIPSGFTVIKEYRQNGYDTALAYETIEVEGKLCKHFIVVQRNGVIRDNGVDCK